MNMAMEMKQVGLQAKSAVYKVKPLYLAKKETNIKGSQVLGNKINITAQNLNIESLQ
ncbi:hemagglutinin repeat-containing protein, partial [Tessaracoccus sp. OH4464_COT-324]|uniref:hemagglutinin repeat-containing protein n=1 Tax=Tessaracoccus sp. OH4464_COT-324 TaxID=2491059 RepID=UPI000FA00BBC